MTPPAMTPAGLPMRMTRPEVCGLARMSPAELGRRIKAKTMPAPCDDKVRPHVFDRDAVLRALGMVKDEAVNPNRSYDPVAVREALAREVRERQASKRRDVSRPVRAAAKAAPLRLVADNAAASHGAPNR